MDAVQHTFVMGTDSYGRDIYARVLYGGRVSLVVGASVALLSVLVGVVFGLAIGAARWLDGVVMRVMDGVMAIPGILLAITLVALWRASLCDRDPGDHVYRNPAGRSSGPLARAVDSRGAVRRSGSLGRDPGAQASLPPHPAQYRGASHRAGHLHLRVCDADGGDLSFLGVGLPPEVPTWGNIMAEGRLQFNEYPHSVLFPGVFLALTVLSVNMLGDGLRDTLDPHFGKRGDRP